jgi:hypothetical protein
MNKIHAVLLKRNSKSVRFTNKVSYAFIVVFSPMETSLGHISSPDIMWNTLIEDR